MTGRVNQFRLTVRDWLESIYRWGKGLPEKHPVLFKVFAVLSWASLIILVLSLIFVPASRKMMLQFLWSFYAIIQLWVICRSKTISWKGYILFFFSGAYLVTAITALSLGFIHLVFGGQSSDTWSQAVITPVLEEVYKLIPLLVFLFFSRRATSLSLVDYALIGGVTGIGFQFMEEVARRWITGNVMPYGFTLFGGQQIHWEFFDLFPGYFEDGFFASQMMAGHGVHAALTALGLGIAIRLHKYYKGYIYIFPGFLLFWSIVAHAAWNGQIGLPDWIQNLNDLLGSGYSAEPVLIALLIVVTIHDYWNLNKVKSQLPMLQGERWIQPLSEIWRMCASLFTDRAKFGSYMAFFRTRREAGFTILYGKEEAKERLPGIKDTLQSYAKPLAMAAILALLVITAAGAAMGALASTGAEEACLACQFDQLQNWWDRLEWYEQGALIIGAIALSAMFVQFWPAVGFGLTLSGIAGSGHEIAATMRDPRRLLTPSTALALGTELLLNRIPVGRLFNPGRGPSANVGGGRGDGVQGSGGGRGDSPEAGGGGRGEGGQGDGRADRGDAPEAGGSGGRGDGGEGGGSGGRGDGGEGGGSGGRGDGGEGGGSGGRGDGGEGDGSGGRGDGGEGDGSGGQRTADPELRQGMAESSSSDRWGTLPDGTNQGIKHFADYWEKYPERVPSLAQRLGIEPSDFDLSVKGFENFTSQAERVMEQGLHRNVNGKDIYFIEGAQKAKKGIVVIVKEGKFQSMMPSDPKSFGKLQ